MINSIESVQRRFTKTLVGMSCLTYDERWASLRLDQLELSQLHSELLTCFKIIRGFNCLRSWEFFTTWGDSITRGHQLKLRVHQYRIDARIYFFSSHVVTIWNQLPSAVINVSTVSAFATKLHTYNLARYLSGRVFFMFYRYRLKCVRTCLSHALIFIVLCIQSNCG